MRGIFQGPNPLVQKKTSGAVSNGPRPLADEVRRLLRGHARYLTLPEQNIVPTCSSGKAWREKKKSKKSKKILRYAYLHSTRLKLTWYVHVLVVLFIHFYIYFSWPFSFLLFPTLTLSLLLKLLLRSIRLPSCQIYPVSNWRLHFG